MPKVPKQHAIPFYNEINDFLAAIPSPYRTADPDFYCLRLREQENAMNNYMPPFRKGFYFMALVTNAGDTRITYDDTDVTRLDSFLVFQSPGHLYSFYRDPSASGYLVYFKKELFSFYRADFEAEFPFFDVLKTNFYKINSIRFREFQPLLEDVFRSYEQGPERRQVTALRFLTALYEFKAFARAADQWQEGFSTPQQILFQKFMGLVNNYYIDKRTVEEYAALLNISAHHLSQSVKHASGRNALSFINERLAAEAKALVRHTGYDIAEIAYQLNFSDPANFGKFFRKHTGMAPLAYRRQ